MYERLVLRNFVKSLIHHLPNSGLKFRTKLRWSKRCGFGRDRKDAATAGRQHIADLKDDVILKMYSTHLLGKLQLRAVRLRAFPSFVFVQLDDVVRQGA